MAAALTFHVACIALVMATDRFPSVLDELQHFSFMRWTEAHPLLFPHYETMRVLKPDLKTWGAGETWLYHPSPYYFAMAAVDIATHSVLALRLANAAMNTLAVGVMLHVGLAQLQTVSERAVFAGVLVAFPKLAIIGALINNDNLALVAAAVGFAALLRWRGRSDDALIALAFALAGWTKLTALLMLGFAFVFMAAMLNRREPRAYGWAALGILVASPPYVVNLIRYGSVLWHGSAQNIAPAARDHLQLHQYALVFVHDLADSWAALGPSSSISLLGAVIVVGAGFILFAQNRRDYPVATALALAGLATLSLHFLFGWITFLQDGNEHEGTARYYYAVWPGFAWAAAIMWRSRQGAAQAAWTVVTSVSLFAGTAAWCFPALLLTGQPLQN